MTTVETSGLIVGDGGAGLTVSMLLSRVSASARPTPT